MNKVKQIVAHFLRVNASEINGSTKIDYKSFPSSIILHRMYAKLASEGYIIADMSRVLTYNDLLNQMSAGKYPSNLSQMAFDASAKENLNCTPVDNFIGVGIDTELIENFHFSEDIKDEFYKSNFTVNEIEYAQKRSNPNATLAGIFSLKESIVKADNSFIGRSFSELEILHTQEGKPYFDGFSLSVSHSEVHVVAIAIKNCQ